MIHVFMDPDETSEIIQYSVSDDVLWFVHRAGYQFWQFFDIRKNYNFSIVVVISGVNFIDMVVGQKRIIVIVNMW